MLCPALRPGRDGNARANFEDVSIAPQRHPKFPGAELAHGTYNEHIRLAKYCRGIFLAADATTRPGAQRANVRPWKRRKSSIFATIVGAHWHPNGYTGYGHYGYARHYGYGRRYYRYATTAPIEMADAAVCLSRCASGETSPRFAALKERAP
jgi:hypothetical protein